MNKYKYKITIYNDSNDPNIEKIVLEKFKATDKDAAREFGNRVASIFFDDNSKFGVEVEFHHEKKN